MAQESNLEIVINERIAKDAAFRDANSSPIFPEFISSFKGLSYFTFDSKFTLNATFVPASNQEVMSVDATSGKVVAMTKIGIVKFSFSGIQHEFTVFINNNLPEFRNTQTQFFIPFRDLSNGIETNKTGRYLPVAITPGSSAVVLDFNRALNPYNSYNKAYDGLIPPQTNSFNLSVTSGERKYEDR